MSPSVISLRQTTQGGSNNRNGNASLSSTRRNTPNSNSNNTPQSSSNNPSTQSTATTTTSEGTLVLVGGTATLSSPLPRRRQSPNNNNELSSSSSSRKGGIDAATTTVTAAIEQLHAVQQKQLLEEQQQQQQEQEEVKENDERNKTADVMISMSEQPHQRVDRGDGEMTTMTTTIAMMNEEKEEEVTKESPSVSAPSFETQPVILNQQSPEDYSSSNTTNTFTANTNDPPRNESNMPSLTPLPNATLHRPLSSHNNNNNNPQIFSSLSSLATEAQKQLVLSSSQSSTTTTTTKNNNNNNNPSSNNPLPSPTTPNLRVVESGHEHTGRWTRDEHDAFLAALSKYGKEWKKVAAKVKTRTVVQTRTHAQKYFQKLQKMMEDGGGGGSVSLKKGDGGGGGASGGGVVVVPKKRKREVAVDERNSAKPVTITSNTMVIVAPSETAERPPPEPSPAACGTRKLAELAAAQMLAGVASIEKGWGQQPKVAAEEEGARPPVTTGLRVVNPDKILEEEEIKKRRVGEERQSPSTPWTSQLEALVSNQVKTTPSSPPPPTHPQPPHPLNLPPPTRTPLHAAVASGKPSAVARLLSLPSNLSNNISFSPLHSAASLPVGDDAPAEITKMLLASGADVRLVDGRGCTALHWAARCGNKDVVRLLTTKNCPLDAANHDGETALHWAMRAGPPALPALTTLLQDGARPNVINKNYQRPIDVAARGFHFELNNKEEPSSANPEEVKTMRAALLEQSPSCRLLILHHDDCRRHLPKSDNDWEVPDRIAAILNILKRFSEREVTISTEFERAPLELLSRVHSTEYLAFVNDLSRELERREGGGGGTVVPFTPMVQRTILKDDTVKKGGHSDTSFSAGSLKAARRAAGAVQHAVDCVLMNRHRNAFCLIRPPGHHAGINGLISNSESCGFCIFNNVAAGALHALSPRHASRCHRCAIVDIDVHHGNGTEEIVRNCHDPSRLLFFSVHLYDRESSSGGSGEEWKFYPGTGGEDDVVRNVINVPMAPLWREREVKEGMMVGETHNKATVVGNHHNTRGKRKELEKQKAAKAAIAAASTDTTEHPEETTYSTAESTKSSSSPAPTIPPSSTTPNPPPHYVTGVGRRAYRRAIEHRLLPALRAFNPDLILISTGFDAAKGDVGNAKHMSGGRESMGLDLEPEDYAWTTQKIIQVADICCNGRVVSILEGGYGRTPPKESRTDNNNNTTSFPLDKTLFAESAAQHLRAMIDPYNAETSCHGS